MEDCKQINIAIQKSENGFNKHIKAYLFQEKIPFLEVDSYATDVIDVLLKNNVTHYFWNFEHSVAVDIMMSRYLLFALEQAGIICYPNFKTSWHFDDKVAQKYLLEICQTPVVESWVFYNLVMAKKWLKGASYPLVAKLRRGAGSYNVVKLDNYSIALDYTKKMFGKGVTPAPKPFADVKTKFKVASAHGFKGVFNRLKKAPRFIRKMLKAKSEFPNEKGYVYFQKFIPGADCDYRIAMVGECAWGSKRLVRKNDFRASGAGQSIEDPSLIPLFLVKLSFQLKEILQVQSIAFDYVLDKENIPHIVEISYCFGFDGEDGTFYWNKELELFKKPFDLGELLYKELTKKS